MKTIKISKSDVKLKAIGVLGTLFGGAHFILKGSADLVREGEAILVNKIDPDSYSMNRVRISRNIRTRIKQEKISHSISIARLKIAKMECDLVEYFRKSDIEETTEDTSSLMEIELSKQ